MVRQEWLEDDECVIYSKSVDYWTAYIEYMKKKFPSLSYFDIRDDTFSMRPLEDIKKFCKLYKKKVQMRFKCLGDPKTITDEKINYFYQVLTIFTPSLFHLAYPQGGRT